jgi:alkanesulfonate monooxygenase SsuD/methylene tetrahydromethanopterin reductase-like flavin-dependent oxidoreductase (luciferase family)
MKARISVTLEHVGQPLRTILDRADAAAKSGVDGIWLSQTPNGRDTRMLLAALAAGIEDLTIGTAVLPIYMSPPAVMAQTALTLDEISGNRLILGLGRGHRIFGQWMLGGAYTSSVGPVREYLTIVTSLIRTGKISMTGSWFDARVPYSEPRRAQLPVYLGAFGPRMLELAGELADGVLLWMCTPSYVSDVIIPSLRVGWERRPAGHDGFGVVVMMPADASPNPDGDRGCGRSMLGEYLRMENYQKLLAANGFGDDVRSLRASDAMIDKLCAIGGRDLIAERIAEYQEAGVTEVALIPLDDRYFAATIEAATTA